MYELLTLKREFSKVNDKGETSVAGSEKEREIANKYITCATTVSQS